MRFNRRPYSENNGTHPDAVMTRRRLFSHRRTVCPPWMGPALGFGVTGAMPPLLADWETYSDTLTPIKLQLSTYGVQGRLHCLIFHSLMHCDPVSLSASLRCDKTFTAA